MKPEQSKDQFLKRLKAAGHDGSTLIPKIGMEAMFSFYESVRAEGCDVEADGDMLLFQWGIYDWGDGSHFSFNITRQFLLTQDDEEPAQLKLTFRYPESELLKKLDHGTHWCDAPEKLTEFRRFVKDTPAYQTVQESNAEIVELEYERQ